MLNGAPKPLTGSDIRSRFLQFFKGKNHAILPSAPLIPQNDASVLFTTAGMHPLVPFLLGEPHPQGTMLANAQKCVRTGDIDDVGDNRHLTFFEMLGNWSLGSYFKEEAIAWSMEFLTNTKYGLGLDPRRLYVTVFKGEHGVPRDTQAIELWKKEFNKFSINAEVAKDDEVLDVRANIRIIPLGMDDNFWIAGATGPCGGDTEIFYDTRPEEGEMCERFGTLVNSFRLIEIWNNVFMEYEKKEDGSFVPLAKQNVDTGMGLERTAAVLQGKTTVFDTDMFVPLIQCAALITESEHKQRIFADHMRAATFIISDGVLPSNTDRGYVLRRLIRRALFVSDTKHIPDSVVERFMSAIESLYGNAYPELVRERAHIIQVLQEEQLKFTKTLSDGLKEIERIAKSGNISGEQAFTLFSTFGIPFEMTREIAHQKQLTVDEAGFKKEFEQHQEKSRVGSEKKFAGGLSGTSEQEIKYHTATHLLNAALRHVLGTHIMQRGSNITTDRLRFDFSHPEKLTTEQKIQVTDLVNQWISAGLPVTFAEMSKSEAEKTGAMHAFGDKYGDMVKVYSIGDGASGYVSREFCGGPHVENTRVLGNFSITKEEAVAAGIRRIKAVLS